MAYKKKTKKQKLQIDCVIAHVKSTFNNTMVTITTMGGDKIASSSAGTLGFKGSRKGTPYAASQVAATVAKDIRAMGVREAEVNFDGPGSGRESVARQLQAAGIEIKKLRDVTPLPHNGTRAPKKRRV